MSEKGSKGLREMTTGCALAGFLMPILVMIVLIVLGAEMTIASLAALFVMIGFCMFMGFKWERLDAAMAEGVRQVATAAMIMLLVGCMVAAWISSGTIPTLLYYGMKIITPKLFLPILFYCSCIYGYMYRNQLGFHQYDRRSFMRYGSRTGNSGRYGSWCCYFWSILW